VVADPDVLAAHLVEVVQRGAGNGRPGYLGGGQVRHGCERPRPADIRDDVLDDRLHLLRRELVGDGPAGRAADEPEPLLLLERVHLHDDAIGLIRKVVALLSPGLREGDHAVDVEPGCAVRVHCEAERLEAIEGFRLAGNR
jgi:hypothetical protein